jgi:hypothetical protein
MRDFASTDGAPSVDIPMAMDDADQAFWAALDETPFVSMHHLSQLTHLSFVTVDRR